MFNMRDLPQDNKNAFGDGRSEMDDSYMAPPIDIGYSPRFMWDVGASEQTITNMMEGIGGRGGYGSLSPPAMGYYGTPKQPVTFFPVNTAPAGCSKCQQKKLFGADNGMMSVPAAVFFALAATLGVVVLSWYLHK